MEQQDLLSMDLMTEAEAAELAEFLLKELGTTVEEKDDRLMVQRQLGSGKGSLVELERWIEVPDDGGKDNSPDYQPM